ncbi:MAG TPA: YetF domain-containing protein [Gemmatimonadales bacterium]|nr:YetF domain-containing protein [Gemmatimonadales bacterium]
MPHVDWPTLWTNLMHFGAFDSATHPISLLEKVVRPIIVYLILVGALRTVGKRVLAQLNPFDFVVLLTLSNTVQNAIIGNDTSLLGGAVGAGALLAVNAALVRLYYRGPSMHHLLSPDRDICLIDKGRLDEAEMRRLRINAGELTAKAHERGFDSLDEVESAILYPNGTIYFKGRTSGTDAARHAEVLRRLDALAAEVAALRR